MKSSSSLGLFVLVCGIIAACGTNGTATGKPVVTKAALIKAVSHLEDSLKQQVIKGNLAQNEATSVVYADRCLAVYRAFPKSKEAPEYLDKAHVILSASGLYRLSTAYADTLIGKYPTYKNRPMVLQSLATAYDVFLVPREKEKMIYYYQLLLSENPSLPKEEKEQIQFRLDHADLTFEQLIELQSGKTAD